MSLARIMQSEARLLLPVYERQPVLFRHGLGVYLWDSQGKRYLDFLSGIGVNALGHSHPAIRSVIARQAGRLMHVSNLFFHDYQAPLAAKLTKISGMDRAFFCNSGTEAWEGALKLARAYARMQSTNGHKPRWRILAMENSFHGRTFGALATTGQAKYRKPFGPLLPGVTFIRLNDCESLERHFDGSVCALCLETIQGEGGIRPVSQDFFHLARKLTAKSSALLLADEIQCGLGRTGDYFAFQHYGIRPDIVTVAKPLAAGLPLGAILTTRQVAGCMHPGLHGTTFGGGPLACAAALAFLRLLEDLLPHVQQLGGYFRGELENLAEAHPCVREVRGRGLMLGLELASADLAKAVVKQLMHRGIIINRTNETVLRFLPPYIAQRRHVDEVIAALDRALAANSVNPLTSVATRRAARRNHA
jgi:acetylornithine aminotransferase/acetylornithine/N-succinyldiaminopimelate aminotransferase